MPKAKGSKHVSNKLTALAVKAFQGPGRINDGDGLSLSVTKQGYRRWIFRYSYGGKQRDLFLGSGRALTLEGARKLRDKGKQYVQAGTDPAAAMSKAARREAERLTAGIPTFEKAAQEYLRKLEPTFKNDKARQPWELAFFTYGKPICPLSLNAITTSHIEEILEPIWHTKRETARRVRWRLEKVFSAAIVKGYRRENPKGEVITVANPAAWKDNLETLLLDKKRKGAASQASHHPAMPYNDVPEFMSSLAGRGGLAATALRLCILTATRTSEALGARWDEIDTKHKLWTIPAERMKMSEPHIIPLTKPVLEIIAALPRMAASPYLFPGLTAKQHLSQMSMLMLLRRMKLEGVTVHGFRSSFRTWAAECTQFPSEIAEMALAHKVGSDVERAYNRTTLIEKRRALADAWSNFCLQNVTGNVVKLAKGG